MNWALIIPRACNRCKEGNNSNLTLFLPGEHPGGHHAYGCDPGQHLDRHIAIKPLMKGDAARTLSPKYWRVGWRAIHLEERLNSAEPAILLSSLTTLPLKFDSKLPWSLKGKYVRLSDRRERQWKASLWTLTVEKIRFEDNRHLPCCSLHWRPIDHEPMASPCRSARSGKIYMCAEIWNAKVFIGIGSSASPAGQGGDLDGIVVPPCASLLPQGSISPRYQVKRRKSNRNGVSHHSTHCWQCIRDISSWICIHSFSVTSHC